MKSFKTWLENRYLDQQAQEIMDNYIAVFAQRPGILTINLRPKKAKLWKKEMTFAAQRLSQFMSARISPEMKKRMEDKDREIYPLMIQMFRKIDPER